MELSPTLEEKHFIEDIGLFFEQMGMPRMAGRILGALLISDPPAQSITELAEKYNSQKRIKNEYFRVTPLSFVLFQSGRMMLQLLFPEGSDLPVIPIIS